MTNELLFLVKIAKMKSNLDRKDLWGQWHSLTLDQHPTHHQHQLSGPWLLHGAGTPGRRPLKFSSQEVMERKWLGSGMSWNQLTGFSDGLDMWSNRVVLTPKFWPEQLKG